jgi:hypothetical protein
VSWRNVNVLGGGGGGGVVRQGARDASAEGWWLANTTRIGAIGIARGEFSGAPQFLEVDSIFRLRTVTALPSFSAISRTGAGYETQRGIAFGCSLGIVRCFIDPAAPLLGGGSIYCGYILFLNRSAAAAGGESPLGALVLPVEPGKYYDISSEVFSEPFSSGLRVVLSTTPTVVTLPPANYARFTVLALA